MTAAIMPSDKAKMPLSSKSHKNNIDKCKKKLFRKFRKNLFLALSV